MKSYENYPLWIVFFSNFVAIATYLIGACIIYQAGIAWMIFYLVYVLFLEFRLVHGHCVNCYYHGKYCAFGKGKLSSLFFKKGDSKKFACMKITWKDMVPDLMVGLIPLIMGIAVLVLDFSWLLLLLVLILFLLISFGNAIVRGSFACKYCKQREFGCPAEKLFNKGKK